ncbi:MAG: hypothetical protein MHMPM18_002197, partial [Marteilia pararefringens]
MLRYGLAFIMYESAFKNECHKNEPYKEKFGRKSEILCRITKWSRKILGNLQSVKLIGREL